MCSFSGLAGVSITVEYSGLSVLALLPVILALFYGWVIQGFRNSNWLLARAAGIGDPPHHFSFQLVGVEQSESALEAPENASLNFAYRGKGSF